MKDNKEKKDKKELKDLKNNYVYPGYLLRESGQYVIKFPDFKDIILEPCDSINSLVASAQAALALQIIGLMEKDLEPPTPSEILANDIIYVHVVLPYFAGIRKTVYVKKTVTIPEYLNIVAEKKEINFSKAMVDGIYNELECLGIDRSFIEP